MNTSLQYAVLFQALAQPIRKQLLEILSLGPVCVCDLVRLTGKRQPYISQHLSVLSIKSWSSLKGTGAEFFIG